MQDDLAPAADGPGEAEPNETGVSRRSLLKRSGLAVGAIGGVSLLAACGSDDKKAAAATTTTAAAAGGGGSIPDALKNKTIGVAHFSSADEGEATLVAALKEAADKAGLNWEFKEAEAQGKADRAGQVMASFITNKVDVILQMAHPADFVKPQLADAKAAKIPVFGQWTSSELDPGLVADYTPVAAVDEAGLSHFMFSQMYLNHPKGDIKLALINTDLPTLQPRAKVLAGLNQMYPRVKVVDTGVVDLADAVGSATKITNSFMSKHRDLAAIWTNYPPSGVPAAAAVQAANRKVEVYMRIGGKAGLQALKDEKNPLVAMPLVDLDFQSYMTVQLILDHLSGREVNRLISFEQIVPLRTFTKQTAKEADGTGVAGGEGWTRDGGTWKDPMVASWNARYSS